MGLEQLAVSKNRRICTSNTFVDALSSDLIESARSTIKVLESEAHAGDGEEIVKTEVKMKWKQLLSQEWKLGC